VQLQIGEEAKREASAMKAIAVVTMTFLPATFVSVSIPVSTYWLLSVHVWLARPVAQTIFGNNFFSFEPGRDAGRSSFAVSRQFWIYWALSVPLTVATLALWFWWSRWAEHLRLSRTKSDSLRARHIAP
jgi:hypothetical protein